MRKFYKTIFQVTVLSDEPVNGYNLRRISEEIDYGNCVGEFTVPFCEEISAAICVEELFNTGNDPEFFGLNEDGEFLK